MEQAFFASKAETLNAKVAATALATGALLTLVLTHTSASLAPMRIFALATVAFAVWAFSDEMGIHKPLNRAAIVAFAIAAFAKLQILLGVDSQLAGRYLLLYAAFLLLALFFWSVALLHRQRELKVVGTVGLVAAVIPIAAIVVGHIAVGVGAAIGVSSMLVAADGNVVSNPGFVSFAERIFGLWSYVAAWLLWRGHIKVSQSTRAADL